MSDHRSAHNSANPWLVYTLAAWAIAAAVAFIVLIVTGVLTLIA